MKTLAMSLLLILAATSGAYLADRSIPEQEPSPTPTPSLSPTASASANFTPEPSASPAPAHTMVGEYSLAGYMNAVKTGKLVALYYYANWCPICREQFPKFQAAVAAINDPRLATFRVNYNDSETEEDEVTAAKTFQVGYQHTVVIVKDGQQAYKSQALVDYEATLREHLK